MRVQPRASRTELVGRHGDALKIRVAANEALVRFLAERLGVPRSSVAVTDGGGGRLKTVAVSGVGVEGATKRLGL